MYIFYSAEAKRANFKNYIQFANAQPNKRLFQAITIGYYKKTGG